ncbi:hypothetical protein MMC32_006892 [Xylographa parallela]|nr:hypothetical protein [Xylographa parallela]
MTRLYYHNPIPGDYYRRSARAPPMNIAHSSRESPRVHSMGSLTIQESPPRDSDSEKNHHPRRRIAVAVRDSLVLVVGRGKSNVVAILETAKVARIARLLVKKVVPVSSYGYKFEKSQSYDGYGANLVDSVFDPYTNQYGLPAQESQGATGLFGHQDSSRHWPVPDRYSLTYEPELPGKYVPTTLSYSEPGLSLGPALNDNSSYFSMSHLATTLPAPVRSNGRGLPTRQRGDFLPFPIEHGNGSSLGLAAGFTPFVSQHSGSKSSTLWSPERVANGRSHTPTSTESSGAGAYSLSLSSNKASNSPPDTRQTEFGYLTHSPPASSAAPAPDPSSTSRASVAPTAMDSHGGVNSAYDTGLSSDPFLRREFSASNIYTYSTGNGTKADSQASDPSEATLLNGQPYTHLRHPQSQETSLYDSQRRRSSDTTSRLAHRKSIASVGSSRR